MRIYTQSYHWGPKPGSHSSEAELKNPATHISLLLWCPGTAAPCLWQLKPALACRMSESLPGAQDRCTHIALHRSSSKSSPVLFWTPNHWSYKLPKCWFTPWFSFAMNQPENITQLIDLEIVETKDPSKSRSYDGWGCKQVHFPVPYKVPAVLFSWLCTFMSLLGTCSVTPRLHPIAYFW